MAYGTESGEFASVTGIPSGYRLQYNSTQLDVVLSSSATWNAAANGNWSAARTGTAAGAQRGWPGAVLNASTTATVTVILDVPVTLGTLHFGNSGGARDRGYAVPAAATA